MCVSLVELPVVGVESGRGAGLARVYINNQDRCVWMGH